MLHFLPATVRGVILLSLYFINTTITFAVIMVLAVLKFVIPLEGWRDFMSSLLKWFACRWVGVNSLTTRLVNRVNWDVEGLQGLSKDQWYLVVSNHQSWTDILVLQTVFHNRIPFLKFFLKQNLIWVPMLGMAWWALDFPFMKRYSKAFIKKNPHLAGKDLETTKKACEKFKKKPVSVMNFVEGTRFTPEKHQRQNSPYKHLLVPRAGGVAFVMGSMGQYLNAIINVSIAYPTGNKSFWDFMCGRTRNIRVRVSSEPVSPSLMGDYAQDPVFREHFQQWVNDLWEQKDEQLNHMQGENPIALSDKNRPENGEKQRAA